MWIAGHERSDLKTKIIRVSETSFMRRVDGVNKTIKHRVNIKLFLIESEDGQSNAELDPSYSNNGR